MGIHNCLTLSSHSRGEGTGTQGGAVICQSPTQSSEPCLLVSHLVIFSMLIHSWFLGCMQERKGWELIIKEEVRIDWKSFRFTPNPISSQTPLPSSLLLKWNLDRSTIWPDFLLQSWNVDLWHSFQVDYMRERPFCLKESYFFSERHLPRCIFIFWL